MLYLTPAVMGAGELTNAKEERTAVEEEEERKKEALKLTANVTAKVPGLNNKKHMH